MSSADLLSFDWLLIAAGVSFALSRVAKNATIGTREQSTPPRLGGVALVLALCVNLAVHCVGKLCECPLWPQLNLQAPIDERSRSWCCQILLWSIYFAPVFAIGLLEDVSNNLSVSIRLWASLALGLTLAMVGGVRIVRLDLPFIPALDALGLPGLIVSFLLSALAISGFVHAMNIVDGLHGLASGLSIIMLMGLGAVAFNAGLIDLANTALLICVLSAGFFLVNFPKGLLYLGDSGAYFLGFFVAVLAVAIPARDENVSPWSSLLICSYPIIEVLFSILRRLNAKRGSPSKGDQLHLHSLLYRRVIRNKPIATVVLLVPITVIVTIAVLASNRPTVLQAAFVTAVIAYVLVYRQLLKPFLR